MSGIGSSLADLDKTVNKDMPGGWPAIAALALGGAGAAGEFSGLGAGAAGATSVGAGAGAGAGTGAAGGIATGAVGGAGSLATQSALGLGGFGVSAPAAGSTFGALTGGAAPVAGAALTPSAALAVPGSAEAIYAAQTASNASGAANPFSISPMQAMMANKALGGFGQQQPSGQSSSVGIKRGQPVNLADPIATLLAPKMKKKERISLL